jgi:hypothetical protein
MKRYVFFILSFALVTAALGTHLYPASAQVTVSYTYSEGATVVVNCTDSSVIVEAGVASTDASLVHFPTGVNMTSPDLANVTMLTLTFANNASTLQYWITGHSNVTQIADMETPILASAFNTSFSSNSTNIGGLLKASHPANVTYICAGKQNLTQYTGNLMAQCLASNVGGFSLAFLPLSLQPGATLVAGAEKVNGSLNWTWGMGVSYATNAITGSGDHTIDFLALLRMNSIAPSPYASFEGLYQSSISLLVFSNTTESFVSCQPGQVTFLQRGWIIMPHAAPARLEATFTFWTDSSPVNTLTLTFGGIVIPVESHVNVPFYYQDNGTYCGPACLQMVFNYYGENVSQDEIAAVARTDPVNGTYTDDLRRAAQFSNLSTSMSDNLPYNITGYTLRSLGYAAFEAQGMNLSMLKSYISQGKPLILLMWYSGHHIDTHYRVAVGYNQTCVFLDDPWNKPSWGGAYGGPDIAFNDTYFMDLWSYWNYWALYVCPWSVQISAPTYVKAGTSFQVQSTITYPQPLPNSLADYPASSCNASIALPANLSLAQGEVQKKTIGTGLMTAGSNVTVDWELVANSPVSGTMNITVEGLISGSVYTEFSYPAYNYADRIGATANFTITLKEDNSPPAIGTLSRNPASLVQPGQTVEISTNVTDAESGVQNVTLYYSIDNGTTWQNEAMSLNQTIDLYEAMIPGQQPGTTVRFKVSAFDGVGNNATYDGLYSVYQVAPEFPSTFVFPSFVIATLLVIVIIARRRGTSRFNPESARY